MDIILETPHKKKRNHFKIGIFGDSVTYGSYIKNNWYVLLRDYLESFDELNVEIFNLGINGDDSNNIRGRFYTEASVRKLNKIIFAFGVNDSAYILKTGLPLTSTQKFEENINELITQAKKLTNDITFIGPTLGDDSLLKPFPPSSKGKSYDTERVEQYDKILKDIGQKAGYVYIDTFGLLEHEDFSDGLHPNENGHKKLYQIIKSKLIF